MPILQYPTSNWIDSWYGPDHFGSARAGIEHRLETTPGKQLVFVRYSDDHEPSDEWVYNNADLDASKVIWARAMDFESDAELASYYHGRRVWMVLPDERTPLLTPYSGQDSLSAVMDR